MATYHSGISSDFDLLQRLCRHHDHLKSLTDSYNYMRRKETYERMIDLNFRCDLIKMKKLDDSYFTSLIIKLSENEGNILFTEVKKAYREIKKMIQHYYRNSKPEIYFDSAHITLKSILDDRKLNKSDLEKYLPVVKDIVETWINKLGKETCLYGMGLFTNLDIAKGLSIGIRFYPTLPLVQIIRGEIGNALYRAVDEEKLDKDDVRPENKFHTMLTHSTGLRIRDLDFPLHPEFIQKFVQTVERYDKTIFGFISDIKLADIYVRNGKSDKLTLVNNKSDKIGEEICLDQVS